MASVRRLPEASVLQEHVERGETNREIAEHYGVTGEAVRQALVRDGIARPDSAQRPSHAHYVPWRLRGDHVNDVLARRLRSYSKHQQGRQLSETESRLLDEWMKFMEGDNSLGLPLSVHYDRNDEEGFWLEARKPGDRDYICPPD